MNLNQFAKTLKGVFCLLGSVCFMAQSADPQPGTRDPSFNAEIGASDVVQDLALQSDGKILLLGWFEVQRGVKQWGVRRLHSDGSRDTGFNATTNLSGVMISDIENAFGSGIQLGTDGKIVLAGRFTKIDSITQTNVARLNENGTLDSTFNPPALTANAQVFPSIYAVAIQKDGKTLIAGDFNFVNGVPRNYLARLNVDGSFDSSFDAMLDNNGTDSPGRILAIVQEPDGKILFRGTWIRSVQGSPSQPVVRLNMDGSLSPVPATSEDLNQAVKASRKSFDAMEHFFAIDAEDRRLTEIVDPEFGTPRLVRWTSSGTLDDGFNFIPNAGPRNSVITVLLQPDGKMLAAGSGGLVRLLGGEATPMAPEILTQPKNATVDEYSPFSVSVVAYGFPKPTYQWHLNDSRLRGENNPALYTPDARILDAGQYSVVISNAMGVVESRHANITVRPFKAALSPSTEPGAPDLGFSPEGVFSTCGFCFENRVRTGLLIQKDDKILVAGYGLRRLHSNGQLDGRFKSGLTDPTTSLLPFVYDLAVQEDGRILMCGTFTNVHGTRRAGIARLLDDGTLDTTFDTGTAFPSGSIQALAVESDGQLLVAGNFGILDGEPRPGLARLNVRGELDRAFDAGLPTGSAVRSVLVQSTGAILISGSFVSVHGIARPGIARLFPSGRLDPDFQPILSKLAQPFLLAVQPDGKVWINAQLGGGTNLARLNADGGLDVLFAHPSGLGLQSPPSLVLQPDGKVIVSGRRATTMRLNADGTKDETFPRLTFFGTGNPVGAEFLALQSDGRIVAAGDFTGFSTLDGVRAAQGFARLFNDPQFFHTTFVPGSMHPLHTGGILFQINAFPGTEVVTEVADNLESPQWMPFKTNKLEGTPITLTDTNVLSGRQRIYRLAVP